MSSKYNGARLNVARQHYQALQHGALSDSAFNERFGTFWMSLMQSSSPVPLGQVPITQAQLLELLQAYGRRAKPQIANADTPFMRTVWFIAESTPGIESTTLWRHLGINREWFLARVRKEVRRLYDELLAGKLGRAKDILCLPHYDENNLDQVLGKGSAVRIASDFVRWVQERCRALHNTQLDPQLAAAHANEVLGLAELMRENSQSREHMRHPNHTAYLQYEQLDPLIAELNKLLVGWEKKLRGQR